VPVTAPADRRFLRAQVKPGARHTPWRTWLRIAWGVVLAFAALVGLIVSTRAVLRSETFRVSAIDVVGNRRLSKGEILTLVDGLRGQSILTANLDEWRERVRACSWVSDVVMRRSLPSTVEVFIVERHALAIGRIGEDLMLVDEHGGVIDEYGPRYADLDLPILDGIGGRGGHDDAAMNEQRAQLASRLLEDIRRKPELARRISQVDVSDPKNAVVIVDKDTARIRLGEEQFVERLQSYVDLAPSLRDHVPVIDYVDLRYGERVFVGAQAMVGGAAVAGGKKSATTNQ
jgi:cell division septal protein FtsQ